MLEVIYRNRAQEEVMATHPAKEVLRVVCLTIEFVKPHTKANFLFPARVHICTCRALVDQGKALLPHKNVT